jgi:hypothetical protein
MFFKQTKPPPKNIAFYTALPFMQSCPALRIQDNVFPGFSPAFLGQQFYQAKPISYRPIKCIDEPH